eukprot:711358-Hanusia_phi.AAC.4
MGQKKPGRKQASRQQEKSGQRRRQLSILLLNLSSASLAPPLPSSPSTSPTDSSAQLAQELRSSAMSSEVSTWSGPCALNPCLPPSLHQPLAPAPSPLALPSLPDLLSCPLLPPLLSVLLLLQGSSSAQLLPLDGVAILPMQDGAIDRRVLVETAKALLANKTQRRKNRILVQGEWGGKGQGG